MTFRHVLALRGPNLWSPSPAVEAWVDLRAVPDLGPAVPAGAEERFRAELPALAGIVCADVGDSGRADGPAALLARIALASLAAATGAPAGSGWVRATAEPGLVQVAIEAEEEALGRAALDAARGLIAKGHRDRSGAVRARVEVLRRLAQQVRLGPSTAALVAAARARGIPIQRLAEGSLVRLGHGARQRRILATETDRTGAIAQEIAQDKDLTRALLQAVGVPVPEGRAVADAGDAWTAACALGGGPVVVKPRYGSQGRGVTTELRTRAQVEAAYDAAVREGGSVLVERFAPGADFRLLVVAGRVVAAARREPAQVVGDGRRTVAELAAAVNRDPRRGDDHATALSRIRLDDPAALGVLREQGHSPVTVPLPGARVLIRRTANLSTGGTAADVTDLLHPEVAARAVEAARVVGLDVAGVDVVARDIALPLEGQGGVVLEVNAAPGLRMHLEPSVGSPRPVAEAILGALFSPGADGRIPIVAVSGVNGKTTTTRLIAHLLARSGRTVGMTCTDGIAVAGRWIAHGDCAGPQSARAVLLNPAVEAAVLETARGGILREGLGFDRCAVAVVTNIGEGDHLGQAGIDTPERLAEVKRVLVRAVAPDGFTVLNAADPLVAALASHSDGAAVFFAREETEPALAAHRASEGRAAFARGGVLVLAEGDREVPVVPLERVPVTYEGRVAFHVENALAAAAAGWVLGIPVAAIRAALESFPGGPDGLPGRFNLLDRGGATVVVDYVHNPSALAALVAALDQFPHHRRTAVYSVAGDRRDADIVRQGEQLGAAFDRVILYEDTYNRGRPDGEVVALLRRGVARGRRAAEVQAVHGGLAAAALALDSAGPGDLVVLQPNDIDETLAYLRHNCATPVVAVEGCSPDPLG